MNPTDKMNEARAAFNDAAAMLFKHMKDIDLIGRHEDNLERASQTYQNALLDLAATYPIDHRLRHAFRKLAETIDPFVFQLSEVIRHHREHIGQTSAPQPSSTK